MRGRVDIDEAIRHPIVAGVLDRWLDARTHPDSAPYSGGVLDNWPAIDVDGFALAREEEQRIDAFRRWKERKK